MSYVRKLNRRDFLRAAALTSLGAAVAACAQPTPQVIEKQVPVEKIVKETVIVEKQVPVEKTVKETVVVEKEKVVEKVVTATPVPAKYKEAPILADLVKAGKLPPVDQRVSAEPLVLKPLGKVGQYGGTMNTVQDFVGGTCFLSIAGYDCMLRWAPDAKTIIPNVAKSWEVSADGKVFTLNLRKGMKWSDGQPFTADDVLFYFVDLLGNKELTPNMPAYLTVSGQPVKAEKTDDYTVKLSFAAPNGVLLYNLAYYYHHWIPKHYMKQFHTGYAKKEDLDKMVADAKFKTWVELFGNKNDWYYARNLEYPVIQAWYPTTASPATRYIYKRNPYYFKVDPEGNQLPYVDELAIEIAENAEVTKLRVMSGNSDIQYRVLSFQDYALLKENETKGKYRTYLWESLFASYPALMPDQTCKDPVMRQLNQDDKFRFALSYAINRQQVNEMVFLGKGVPRQATTDGSSPLFKAEWAKAYADYDPKKANALLDEIGLTKKDAAGFRLGPDGKPLTLTLDGLSEDTPIASTLELCKGYFEAVGLKTEVRITARTLFSQRSVAGEISIGSWLYGYVFYPFDPVFVAPTSTSTYWAVQYGLWYATGGKQGEEPKGDLRRLQQIADEVKVTPDQKKQAALMTEYFDLHAKHCWVIGIVGDIPQPIVVSNRLQNVPEKSVYAWEIAQYLGLAPMEQYYLTK